ncbi:hypothetical protein [Oryzobacter terrae]|uniref:hypothetical protein n=1 Tax=Oryzobacter terrae TaxID=1620385 RepID=UPI00366F3570
MSEHDTDEPGVGATDAEEASPPPSEGEARGAPDESGNGRQARRDELWRDRARAAEERAIRLASREVLRLLAQRVSDPEVALAMSGEEVRSLLTDDGDVDEEAVVDLAERMTTAYPTLRPRAHHLDLGPKASPVKRHNASWGSVIRGR